MGAFHEYGDMERPIDCSRERNMLCAGCGHRFRVDLDWIDRFSRVQEGCPGCGLTCEHRLRRG